MAEQKKAAYAIKRWNGKYGAEAAFIVQRNSDGKMAEFQPTRPRDVAWVETDLTAQPDYKGWDDFQNEPVDDINAIVM